MTIVLAHLNRRGVNSVELSAREAPIDAGSDLVLHLKNHGSPTHATIRTQNGQAYTDFFHENLFIDGDMEYRIPIRDSSGDGVFDLELITGYGARSAQFKAVVSKACPVVMPAPVAETYELEEDVSATIKPPLLALLPCIIACIIYLVWLSFRGGILAPVDAFATSLIVLLLLAGIVIACRSPDTS